MPRPSQSRPARERQGIEERVETLEREVAEFKRQFEEFPPAVRVTFMKPASAQTGACECGVSMNAIRFTN